MIGRWPNAIGPYPANWFQFYPGAYIEFNSNTSSATFDNQWNTVFSGGRKVSYRPPGIYLGVIQRIHLRYIYTNTGVRPTNPTDWSDPGYNWQYLNSVFLSNAVQNEGAKVILQAPGMVSENSQLPEWLQLPPYNAQFTAGSKAGGANTPKFNRFTGPDMRGVTNSYASEGPPIVEEMLKVHVAMIGYLTYRGWLDKVVDVSLGGEIAFQSTDAGPAYPNNDQQSFMYGYALYQREAAKLWNAVRIFGGVSTQLNGTNKDITWPHWTGVPNHSNPAFRDAVGISVGFPDYKMTTYGTLVGSSRFEDPFGVQQKDIRPLAEADETNGLREFTYFPAGSVNPWGYSNVTVPQTESHKIAGMSGPPTNANKDSGLGQAGPDPSGFNPVHMFFLNRGANFDNLSYFPTVAGYQLALDTFGPPGTGAFPYTPPGYFDVDSEGFVAGQIDENSGSITL